MIRFTLNRRRHETTSVPRDTRAPPASMTETMMTKRPFMTNAENRMAKKQKETHAERQSRIKSEAVAFALSGVTAKELRRRQKEAPSVQTTSVPRDTRAPPALIHVFGQPAPTAFTTADFPTWPKEQLVPMHPNRPPAMMMPMPSGLGLPTQYYPPYPQHGYGYGVKNATGNVPIPTDSVIYLGAERLNNVLTNMEQAIHTRTHPSTDHFVFDSNPQGSTANKLIRKLRHNNGNGQYGTWLISIDEELNVTISFSITIIGPCGSVDTQLIPLSKMVVYCRTNGLDKFVDFFESVDELVGFVDAIVRLVPKLTAVVKRGTPKADRNIMMQVLQDFFPGLGGENHDYKPTRFQQGGDTSDTKMVSASMVSASIYLPNGNQKTNIVFNQMYHDQSSDQDRNICQRMNQMTTSRESGNLTIIVDIPRQPFTVRAAALDLRDGRQPTFCGQLRHYSSAADYWSEPGNSQAHREIMKALWDDPNSVFNSTTFRDKKGESIKAIWEDSNSTYNSTAYRAKLSESSMGRRYKKTPGVDDMEPCRFCGQPYHIGQMRRHENRCPKNPDKV